MGHWGYFTLLLGVITPFITGKGPPCTEPADSESKGDMPKKMLFSDDLGDDWETSFGNVHLILWVRGRILPDELLLVI